MNKLLPVIAVILLVLVGGGIYLANQNKKQEPSVENNTNVTKTEENKGSVFTSIKDALTKSLSLECTYKDETGIETKTYMKAGAVRVDANAATNDKEAYSQVIFKDNKMYSWNPTTKQGVVFTVPEDVAKDITPVEASAPAEGSSEENKGESFLAQIEKYKDACKTATVSDSLFTVPTDVKFQDLSKMMESIKTNTPKNGSPPSFDIEQLKKQYLPEE